MGQMRYPQTSALKTNDLKTSALKTSTLKTNNAKAGNFRARQRVSARWLMAGGTLVAGVGLLASPHALFNLANLARAQDQKVAYVCQEIIQPKSALTRDQLLQLLSVPERSNQAKVRTIVQAPFCRLSPLEVRPGVATEREVYPLTFDQRIRIVVLYEGNEYVGYGFDLQH